MRIATFMPSGFHKESTQNTESKSVNGAACASKKNKTFHQKAFAQPFDSKAALRSCVRSTK